MTETCGPFKQTAGGCVPGQVEVVWLRKASDASPVLTYQTSVCTAGIKSFTYSFDKAGLLPATGYTIADKVATVIKGERGANCSDPVHVQVCTIPVGTPALSALACDGVTTLNIQADPSVKQVVNAPGTALSVRMCGPTASLKIEFSETLMHSASTEQSLMRIREYNEDTGLWSLRYENLDGTPFVGALPADLTVATAQVQVVRTTELGCSGGQAFVQRTTARFDSETGALESETIDWANSSGSTLAAAPEGFVLGECKCVLVGPVGVIATWG
jgi:hypothetical protein